LNLLLGVNLQPRLRKAADQIALNSKRLSCMPADFAISLTRLRPNGGQATAKLGQETGVLDGVSSKLKYLPVIFVNLSGLRQRCDEPRAESGHRN
jgi:hypothetical protein